MLYANLGATDPTFDLDGNGNADQDDVDELVFNLLGTRYGDADLDGDVDISDFNSAVSHFDTSARNPLKGWAQGTFDGDGDISDVLRMVMNFAPLGFVSLAGNARVDSNADFVSNAKRSRSTLDRGQDTVSPNPVQVKEQPLPSRFGANVLSGPVFSDGSLDPFDVAVNCGRKTKHAIKIFPH